MCPKPAEDSYSGFPVVKTKKVKIPGYNFNLGIPSLAFVERTMKEFQPAVVYSASPYLLGGHAVRAANNFLLPSVSNYQSRVEMFGNNAAEKIFKDKKVRKAVVDGFGKSVIKRTKRIYNHSTLALVPSNASQDDLLRYNIHTLIRQWGRGVDGVLYHPDKKQLDHVKEQRRVWSNNGEKVIAICVGRLSPEKRVERLAALKETGVQIVVVGKGEKAYEKLLRSELPEGTIFTGELTGEELATAVSAAHFSIHTGTEDTFGQTVQEAMAAGNPVIAPSAGGPAEIVTHGRTGLIYDAEDDRALRDMAILLRDNELMRNEMGRNGRREVEDKTWSRYAGLLIDYFYEAIDIQGIELAHR